MNLVGRIRRALTLRNSWRAMCLDENGQLTPAARTALADLAVFCYANKSTVKTSPMTGQVDSHATILAEGRREAFLRIKECLKLDDSDLQPALDRQLDEVYNDE